MMVASVTSQPVPLRLLVVLCRSAHGEELRARLTRLADPRPLELYLLAPAFADSRFEFHASDVDPGIRRARRRLAESARELAPVPVVVEIGEADPLLAIDTALVGFAAEEIVILHSPSREQWAETGLFERVCSEFELPVREIELREDPSGAHAVETACSLDVAVPVAA
jgi:hypothetical protein